MRLSPTTPVSDTDQGMTSPLACPPGGLLGLAGACLLLGAGCSSPQGGTDVGNGRTIKLDLQAFEPTVVTTRSLELSEGVRVDTAFMVIDRVRLVPGSDCSSEDDQEVDVSGPLVADLIDGIVLGDSAFHTTSSEFCELKIGLHDLELSESPPDTPPVLEGLSLRVTGAREDGVPFLVESKLNERFELNAKAGSFSLTDAMARIIVGFRVNDWVTALALETLGDQPIVVSEQSNQDELHDFENAVKDSARLFRDQNDDGNLDASEHDDEDELAD